MGEPLDPELARALQEPARLVRADPRLLDLVRQAGTPAQQQLRAQASDAGTPEDRYASAALLAQLFGDRGPLEQAAHGYGSSPPRELMALTDIDALRPALKKSLASSVHTGLLEWATNPDPAHPPLELAMAARDLQLEDAAVLRSVASRAEQLAAQTGKRGQRPPLEHLADILRRTAEGEAEPGTTAPNPEPDARPAPHDPEVTGPGQRDPAPSGGESTGPVTDAEGTGPGGSGSFPGPTGRGPRVTTEGIPASEMLRPDELDEPAPRSGDYPGTGVPVRDSISGPRPGTERRPPGPEDAPEPSGSVPGDPRDPGAARPGGPGSAPPGGPAAPDGPALPRVPSTSEQYYGAGSDRYADRDPDAPRTREDDKHVLRNWGITFLVIVAVIIVLTLLL